MEKIMIVDFETKINMAAGAFGDMEKALFSVLAWTFLPKKRFAEVKSSGFLCMNARAGV